MGLRFCPILLLLLALFASPAPAQDIEIDWETKSLTKYPTEISKVFNGRLVVKNVNDLIFKYKVEVVMSPRPIDDFRKLFPTPPFGLTATRMDVDPSSCRSLIDAVNGQSVIVKSEIGKWLTPDSDNHGKVVSRPLETTRGDWNQKIIPEIDALDTYAGMLTKLPSCDPQLEEAKLNALVERGKLKSRLDLLQARVDAPHQIEQNVTFSPEVDYKVTVEEIYINGEGKQLPVIDGKREFPFSPASHVLSLSAGALLTTLAQRSYLSRRDPVSGKNVVSVDGAGMVRPIGVALLNYQIPQARWMKHDQMGLSLASGLTFELGSTKSDTSSVGWFGGVSLDFYHRLFITPGIHFGEFADFPVGLGKGSVIPDNFGELNPVKRWTGRFAISITYRTASFGKTAATSESKEK